MNYRLQNSPQIARSVVGISVARTILCSGLKTVQSQQTTPTLTPAQQEAKLELNAAARAYVEGKFEDAQRHSEKALALDPEKPLIVDNTFAHPYYSPLVFRRTCNTKDFLGIMTAGENYK